MVSLYPNLTWEAAGEEVFRAIYESEMEWEGVNWKSGVLYLALCRGYAWCKASQLRRILPCRRYAKGAWPGITGKGPLGAQSESEGEKQWIFPNVVLTNPEKKAVMGEVMRLAVEVLFQTHVYSFKGSNFMQSDGGPIGLGATCAIARVCMARHSVVWKKRLEENNLEIECCGFYVDDGRVFLHAVRAGWRWVQGGLWYCQQWEEEDAELSNIERTKRVIGESMGGIVDCLEFTVESQEDFPDSWLPTLDINIQIDSGNMVNYRFYEKPGISQVCL